MQAQGLRVKSPLAGDFAIPVEATHNPVEMETVDLVLFCVKTYDTQTAAELIRPIVGPQTVVLSVQNGIDNQERIGEFFGTESVMCAVAQISSVVESPGVIEHRSGGLAKILFGEWDGLVSPRSEQLLTTFQRAGIDAELSVRHFGGFVGEVHFHLRRQRPHRPDSTGHWAHSDLRSYQIITSRDHRGGGGSWTGCGG